LKENYIHVVDDTGSDDLSYTAPLLVYPNPAKDIIILSFNNHNQIPVYHWKIADLSGKILLSGSSTDSLISLDLSDLAKGTYLLIVSDDMQQYFKKIIRQ
jgi:hypothetical protein